MGGGGNRLRAGLLFGVVVPGTLMAMAPVARSEMASCGPAVSLRGDRQEVQQLSHSLAKYDPPGSPREGCRAWAVTIWRSGPLVTVELDDGQGQRVVRRVSDVQVAAAVVDSWLHEESVPAAPTPAATIGVAAQDAPPVSRAHDVLVLALGPDVVGASDGSAWLGGHASACVALGKLCVGGIVQGARGRATEIEPGMTRRTTGTLLAAAHLPVALGPVTLVPGLGLGVGLARSSTSDPPPATNPLEPTGARDATTFDALASARLVLAVPLAGSFGLDVGGAFDLSLAPHDLARDEAGDPYLRDPRFFVRGGIALRYGRP